MVTQFGIRWVPMDGVWKLYICNYSFSASRACRVLTPILAYSIQVYPYNAISCRDILYCAPSMQPTTNFRYAEIKTSQGTRCRDNHQSKPSPCKILFKIPAPRPSTAWATSFSLTQLPTYPQSLLPKLFLMLAQVRTRFVLCFLP